MNLDGPFTGSRLAVWVRLSWQVAAISTGAAVTTWAVAYITAAVARVLRGEPPPAPPFPWL